MSDLQGHEGTAPDLAPSPGPSWEPRGDHAFVACEDLGPPADDDQAFEAVVSARERGTGRRVLVGDLARV